MNTYRVLTSESHWDDKHMLYGIELSVDGVKVRGHNETKEVVFEASDHIAAESVFAIYAKQLRNAGGKWSVSLQQVKEVNGVIRRIRTLRIIIGPQ